MGDLFHAVDLTVFLIALVAVMAVGLLAGRGETESSEQYFLAGRHIRWWGVAGSIYGSNVSANHLVGMLGLGFSIGFAQSHFGHFSTASNHFLLNRSRTPSTPSPNGCIRACWWLRR